MTDFLEPMRRELKRLNDRIDGLSTFQWALVTSINPTRIHFAGDADPVTVPPDTITANLVVGDMVRVERKGAHMTVHGIGGGAADRIQARRGTTAQRIALATSGEAREGMKFYDTDENREYVWAGSSWTGGRVSLSGYLVSGFTGPLDIVYSSGICEVTGYVNGGSVPSAGGSVSLASAIPSELHPNSTRNVWGTAWADAYIGGFFVRPDGSFGISNRSGVGWDTGTNIQLSLTYLAK